MGSFDNKKSNFSYYENPALLNQTNSYLSCYQKYSRKDLKTVLLSNTYKNRAVNLGFYILHFQEKPYKEEEYGVVLAKEVYENLFLGINLKLLRNIVFKKDYLAFSYDIGGLYNYKNHHIGISFRNMDKPYLLARVNLDFIFKYSYIRKNYNLNFKYVKIFSLYEYYLIGCEFQIVKHLKLSYALTTKKKENRMGFKLFYDKYQFDFAYIIHPVLKNYLVLGVGIKW